METNQRGIKVTFGKLFATRRVTLSAIFSWKATIKCLIGCKKQERGPPIEEVMLSFITEAHAKGLPVVHRATVAREIAKFLTIDERNLKTIEGWREQLMSCTGLSLRGTISTYQKLPADFEQTALNLQPDAIDQ